MKEKVIAYLKSAWNDDMINELILSCEDGVSHAQSDLIEIIEMKFKTNVIDYRDSQGEQIHKTITNVYPQLKWN